MVARLARLARLASTLTATIFGSQGVFAAALWPLNSTDTYILAGFRAFRGFDGRTARFGDTSVQSTSTSAHDVVYSSHDGTHTRSCRLRGHHIAVAALEVRLGRPSACFNPRGPLVLLVSSLGRSARRTRKRA